jgi:hypothetical protein
VLDESGAKADGNPKAAGIFANRNHADGASYIPVTKIVGNDSHLAESSDKRQKNFATAQPGTPELGFNVGSDFEHVRGVDASIADIVHADDGYAVGGFASGLDDAV